VNWANTPEREPANSIAVYSVGLQTALAASQQTRPSRVCGTLTQLMNQIGAASPSLVLIELTPEVTLDALKRIRSRAGTASIILCGEAVSAEFATQAVGLGIRGILRKDLSVELHLKQLLGNRAHPRPLLKWRQAPLTTRERQLLGYVSQGLKNRAIAQAMGITEGTVKVYLSRLCDKVGATDRVSLAAMGRRSSLSRA
jgi:two-component system, NarL family, nitrate/nitrite response regulator NarL